MFGYIITFHFLETALFLKVLDMEHELRALGAQLQEKSLLTVKFQKQVMFYLTHH